MIIYFKEDNEAIDTESIAHLYPLGKKIVGYVSPVKEDADWAEIFDKLAKGVEPGKLTVDGKSEDVKSVIVLKTGGMTVISKSVEEIVGMIRGGKC